MKYFFDNCISPRIAKAVTDLDEDVEVVHLREMFDPSTPDSTWIAELGKPGEDWIVITDDRIYKSPVQKEVLRRAGCIVFYLAKGWGNFAMMLFAQKLIGLWDKIKETAGRANKGDFYKVGVNGKIEKYDI